MQKQDLVAGISVAGIMLPEAVAYAAIAGLPPQRAIIAGIAGCLVYAAFGRSRFAIVSPTSSSAAILAATLATMPGTIAEKAGYATIAVLLTGTLFVLAALFRLGGLTGLISRPVLRGFAFGLAMTIIIRQLPTIAGVEVHSATLEGLLGGLVAVYPAWNWYSMALGAAALALLLSLRKLPYLPGAFIVLCLGIVCSYVVDLGTMGIEMVGQISVLPQLPRLPVADLSQYSQLAQFALPLALILFAESWGTVSSLALRHGEKVTANRELGALGLANLASALLQGMPVGAGFSAGSASESAGAASRMTAVIAASGLATLIFLAAPLVARLPQPVLAAVVIAVLTHALDPAPFIRLWTLRRDLSVALLSAASVLAFGVLNGMLVAIAVSVALLIQRMASPRMAALGRLGGSHDFVDISRHNDATALDHIAIWRPSEPLFFANASLIVDAISDHLQDTKAIRGVIISLEETFDLDSTSVEALLEFDHLLKAGGVVLRLARVHDHVRDVLALAGDPDLLSRCSYSVDNAVMAMTDQLARQARTG